jgi:hypothetical protein
MSDECQQWLGQRAYGIWEAEGRPIGRDLEHWEQAEREFAASLNTKEGATGSASTPEPANIKTPRRRTASKPTSASARSRKKIIELRP